MSSRFSVRSVIMHLRNPLIGKKRLSTAEWYPLNNPHKPKTCGKDQASVFKSWGGDYEKVLIGHFWLTVSDGALFFFFPSGIPYSGLSFQMHATPHKLTPDERREAFKKHLTRVWIFKNALDPKKNKKHNLITEGIVESTILVTNVSSDCKGLSASEAHCWVFQQTKAYQSLGGTSQWSHYETFQTKRTWGSGGNEGCRVDVREEKEIEQTVRGYRGGESFVLFFFPSPPILYLEPHGRWMPYPVWFCPGGHVSCRFRADQFQDQGEKGKKVGFLLFFLEPLHLGALKTTQNPSHRPKFRLPPGLSFIIRVSVNNVRCGLNFSELCH